MMTRIGNSFHRAALFLLMFSSTAFSSFDASVDRSHIALHETLELTLRADTDSDASPDLSILEKSFDILGTRRSQQIRIINGRSESWKDWVVTLSPKKTGTLTIPPIPFGSEHSKPITISVQKNSTQAGDITDISPVFMKAQLSHETVYTQQELILTLRIFHSVSLYDDSRLSSLDINDAIVNQLGDTQRFETTIDGKRYGVFEVKYAIYPQKAGTLTIPSLSFTGTMADPRDPFQGVFSMGGQPVRARSAEIPVKVLSPPASYQGHDWLPSRGLTLNETWSQPPDSIKVGDAVTRTITIEAKGLTAAQLPPLNIPSPTGVNTYSDQSSTSDTPTNTGIIGKRVSAVAMVPTKEGVITLPAISITWFDTNNHQSRTATIPEKSIEVLPGNISSPVRPSPAPTASPLPEKPDNLPAPAATKQQLSLWQWVALGFSGLWLITICALFWLWRRSKRSSSTLVQSSEAHSVRPQSASEQGAFRAFQAACLEGQKPQLILETMKKWCRLFVNDHSLKTAQQCADRLDSEQLRTLCAELDAAIYAGENNSITGQEILSVCSVLRKNVKVSEKEDNLSDIYPA
ncbi:BatD family protein [Candidatus Sororendozoicomonas aggregata]|uniref:BatD family protein n=1 Tax=Candidatus Sororendozoicomonas aggregata TaxID=3073239 RepID=UPI002ED06D86